MCYFCIPSSAFKQDLNFTSEALGMPNNNLHWSISASLNKGFVKKGSRTELWNSIACLEAVHRGSLQILRLALDTPFACPAMPRNGWRPSSSCGPQISPVHIGRSSSPTADAPELRVKRRKYISRDLSGAFLSRQACQVPGSGIRTTIRFDSRARARRTTAD